MTLATNTVNWADHFLILPLFSHFISSLSPCPHSLSTSSRSDHQITTGCASLSRNAHNLPNIQLNITCETVLSLFFVCSCSVMHVGARKAFANVQDQSIHLTHLTRHTHHHTNRTHHNHHLWRKLLDIKIIYTQEGYVGVQPHFYFYFSTPLCPRRWHWRRRLKPRGQSIMKRSWPRRRPKGRGRRCVVRRRLAREAPAAYECQPKRGHPLILSSLSGIYCFFILSISIQVSQMTSWNCQWE